MCLQAGVAAMYARGGTDVAAACEAGAWPLALAPGQNQFTIMVTAPEAAAQARLSLTPCGRSRFQGPVTGISRSRCCRRQFCFRLCSCCA